MPEEVATGSEEAGPSSSGLPEFIASPKFSGAKAGYVFKSDALGVGYYVDVPFAEKARAAAEASKAKPTVIKSSSTMLKSLQKRGPVVIPSNAPKKAKTDDKKDGKAVPAYLREMERYKSLSCSADTKHDRPLVK
ncbi:hypothetical protein TSOC_001560 [Tetrabaena socialis]|uniref:Uncharacterized protein n=1 Tax=Tetrabaena socialis TaxID=47790 RepID=A0A2J8AGH3_9CHLO|nr:hypothetical protein TSOC_001560 [Tetrabaena socialis]|eukprot:PNH11602.1 hypothetical protein TSOC_001560 [Tetrabaena socialis]